MKLTLNNEADIFTAGQVASLQNPRSVTAVIAAYLLEESSIIPFESDCQITVAKSLLPDSYKGNPSLFAAKVLEKLDGKWSDSSGYQTPNKRTHVTIQLLRKAKPLHARRAHATPSIKQIIKNWLDLNLHKMRKLTIPLAGVPAFYASHPEQLVYAIKRETETPIRILKAKTTWIIARK